MQPSQQHRIRTACEACHERKQRCIIPDTGSACQSCQQNKRHCYFMPRFKPGRPRRSKSDEQAVGRAPVTIASSVPANLNSQTPQISINQHTHAFQVSQKGQDAGSLHFVSTGSVLDHGLEYSNMDWGRFDNFSNNQSNFFPGSAASHTPPLHTSPAVLMSGSGNNSTDWQLGSTTQDYSYFDIPISNAWDYVPILTARISELHQCIERLESQQVTQPGRGELSHTLSVVNIICTQSLNVTGASMPYLHDSALTAVVLAAMVKVFSLCETIVSAGERQLLQVPHARALSGDHYDARALDCYSVPGKSARLQPSPDINFDYIMMLKQLDLNLTQAKICLSRLAKQREMLGFITDTDKSTGLHQRILALINNVCK